MGMDKIWIPYSFFAHFGPLACSQVHNQCIYPHQDPNLSLLIILMELRACLHFL